jgi:hypothetical protein
LEASGQNHSPVIQAESKEVKYPLQTETNVCLTLSLPAKKEIPMVSVLARSEITKSQNCPLIVEPGPNNLNLDSVPIRDDTRKDLNKCLHGLPVQPVTVQRNGKSVEDMSKDVTELTKQDIPTMDTTHTDGAEEMPPGKKHSTKSETHLNNLQASDITTILTESGELPHSEYLDFMTKHKDGTTAMTANDRQKKVCSTMSLENPSSFTKDSLVHVTTSSNEMKKITNRWVGECPLEGRESVRNKIETPHLSPESKNAYMFEPLGVITLLIDNVAKSPGAQVVGCSIPNGDEKDSTAESLLKMDSTEHKFLPTKVTVDQIQESGSGKGQGNTDNYLFKVVNEEMEQTPTCSLSTKSHHREDLLFNHAFGVPELYLEEIVIPESPVFDGELSPVFGRLEESSMSPVFNNEEDILLSPFFRNDEQDSSRSPVFRKEDSPVLGNETFSRFVLRKEEILPSAVFGKDKTKNNVRECVQSDETVLLTGDVTVAMLDEDAEGGEDCTVGQKSRSYVGESEDYQRPCDNKAISCNFDVRNVPKIHVDVQETYGISETIGKPKTMVDSRIEVLGDGLLLEPIDKKVTEASEQIIVPSGDAAAVVTRRVVKNLTEERHVADSVKSIEICEAHYIQSGGDRHSKTISKSGRSAPNAKTDIEVLYTGSSAEEVTTTRSKLHLKRYAMVARGWQQKDQDVCAAGSATEDGGVTTKCKPNGQGQKKSFRLYSEGGLFGENLSVNNSLKAAQSSVYIQKYLRQNNELKEIRKEIEKIRAKNTNSTGHKQSLGEGKHKDEVLVNEVRSYALGKLNKDGSCSTNGDNIMDVHISCSLSEETRRYATATNSIGEDVSIDEDRSCSIGDNVTTRDESCSIGGDVTLFKDKGEDMTRDEERSCSTGGVVTRDGNRSCSMGGDVTRNGDRNCSIGGDLTRDGDRRCSVSENVAIDGDRSCSVGGDVTRNGDRSCSTGEVVTSVGSSSCNSGEDVTRDEVRSCNIDEDVTSDRDRSCIGEDVTKVGDRSCIGEDVTKVGNRSCIGEDVTKVGDRSCIGEDVTMDGDRSCIGEDVTKVGDRSCIGEDVTMDGDRSCIGEDVKKVGNRSCIGEDVTRDDNEGCGNVHKNEDDEHIHIFGEGNTNVKESDILTEIGNSPIEHVEAIISCDNEGKVRKAEQQNKSCENLEETGGGTKDADLSEAVPRYRFRSHAQQSYSCSMN